ncbi:hypothetical protein DY000_02037099 [Brassica cretica]|uniref:Derlin n=1 Tax=Brassica cretica TaxID=69181 RepID=A0ABQ7BG82_BRACR|nr:hypothetical protein DY000_02037099 [Brassica cretica]
MSSPGEYYNSLPPITKAYGTLCLLATTLAQLGLLAPIHIALIPEFVFKHFQVWRLITNLFFLGGFSINFGIRLLMIARYGVLLEKGPFERRTADFLWMMIFGSLTLLGPGGVTIKKTNQAFVFGIYDEPMTGGQCNLVVERLGDYLIESDL